MIQKQRSSIQAILKWIYCMNLSSANKNLFTVSFILYLQNKTLPNTGILLKGFFNSKLPNNPVACR